MAAMDLGIEVVKFFPADVYGGAAALKALSAPFAHMRFVPTGGVSEATLGDFLRLPTVPAVGGSWMVRPQYIASGQFEAITALAKDAVSLAATF